MTTETLDYTDGQTFAAGDRVELHPAHDAWMSGDHYATVTRVGCGPQIVWVQSDKTRRQRWMFRASLRHV